VIRETITRLQTTVPALKLVDGAPAFQAAAETNPRVTPCAFVLAQKETPSPSGTDVLIQRVAAEVGIVLVVRNLTDAKGVAATEDMESLRNAVKAQLFGWVPVEGCDPFERGPGGLLLFRDGHMWWQDIYSTSYFDRSSL